MSIFSKYSIMSGVEKRNVQRIFDDAWKFGEAAHIVIDWERARRPISDIIADDVAVCEGKGVWSVSPEGYRMLRDLVIAFEHRNYDRYLT